MKKTQIEIIINQLKETGKISRNWCLSRYISRLGAIIHSLKQDGWDFETERVGGDYVYKVITNPLTPSFDPYELFGNRVKA